MTPPLTLAELSLNQESEIRDLAGDPIVIARLRELGFTRGERVKLSGRALFGDPLLIEIRGATVALRRKEAACVQL